MGTDVNQQDLVFLDPKLHDYAVVLRERDGMKARQLALQRVRSEAWLKRIGPKIAEESCEPLL